MWRFSVSASTNPLFEKDKDNRVDLQIYEGFECSEAAKLRSCIDNKPYNFVSPQEVSIKGSLIIFQRKYHG
jgi:hypothetical protein